MARVKKRSIDRLPKQAWVVTITNPNAVETSGHSWGFPSYVWMLTRYKKGAVIVKTLTKKSAVDTVVADATKYGLHVEVEEFTATWRKVKAS